MNDAWARFDCLVLFRRMKATERCTWAARPRKLPRGPLMASPLQALVRLCRRGSLRFRFKLCNDGMAKLQSLAFYSECFGTPGL